MVSEMGVLSGGMLERVEGEGGWDRDVRGNRTVKTVDLQDVNVVDFETSETSFYSIEDVVS